MSDNYQIQDLSSNHTYRTELPNILFHLGLDPYELAVYCSIKRIAGDNGQCFMNAEKIAQSAGMERNKYMQVKKDLAKKTFQILNDKSLIQIQKRVDEKKCNLPDLITITDIWPENYTYFLEKKKANPCIQKIQPPVSNKYNPCIQEGHKEEPLKKNPYEEEPPPLTPPIENGGGAVVQRKINEVDLEESLVVTDPKGHKIALTGTEIFNHFLPFGFATSIIKQAIQVAKNDPNPITSPLRYLEAVCSRLSKSSETKNLMKQKFDKNDGVPPKYTGKGVNFYGEPSI